MHNSQQPAPGGQPGRPTSAPTLFPELESEREPGPVAPGAYGPPRRNSNFRMRYVTLPDGTSFVVRPLPIPEADPAFLLCNDCVQPDDDDRGACEAQVILDRYELTSDAGDHAQVDAYRGFATCDCADFRRDWHCAHVEALYLSGLAPLGPDARFTSSNPGLLPTLSGGAR